MENTNINEEQSTADMISEYAGLLLHWLWLVVLLALIGGGTAYYLSSRQKPVYQASAMAMINMAQSAQDNYTSMYISQQLGSSYSRMMTTQKVLASVADRLGMENISGSVRVSPIPDTQLLTITVTNSDPEEAALIANTSSMDLATFAQNFGKSTCQ